MNHKIYTGLVLRKYPLREADDIVSFWSWEEGKVRLLARSVRKQTSKLKAILAPAAWMQLYAVPSGQMAVVTSASIIKNYPKIPSSLESTSVLFSVLEMVSKATGDDQPNEKISLLLQDSLAFLDEHDEAQKHLDFYIIFIRELMSALGFRFDLSSCSKCGKGDFSGSRPYLDRYGFSVICQPCTKYFPAVEKIDLQVWEYLNKLEIEKGFQQANTADKSTKLKTSQALSRYFQFVIEREIKSQKFLEQNLAL